MENLPERYRVHTHILTPGDHYSPATGSAIPTIVYELTRQHVKNGGESRLIVGVGTRHDYPVGECVEVQFAALPDKKRKAVDVVLARLNLPRFYGPRTYLPASAAIPSSCEGPIFVHNNPAPIQMIKRRHPAALVCLWCNNALFRTYSRAEVNRIALHADRIICCSHFIADDVKSRLDANHDKVRVVFNGVDPDRFRPDPQADKGECPTVLFLGRVIPEKGVDLLLKAACKLQNGKRKFKVRIVGSSNFNANDPLSPYEQELRRIAEPIRNLVEFQPFVDRVRVVDEYRKATVFCVPSNWDEPISMTISEGMACGIPVIAARRGGLPEAGGDAVQYFTPPDVEELADILARLLDDDEARRTWGERARARAQELSWANLYRMLCTALADDAPPAARV
jgi:glycosyltransferase involved in cell wall biosynthesis